MVISEAANRASRTERQKFMEANTTHVSFANVADLSEDSPWAKFYAARQQGTTWKQMPESIRRHVSYHQGSLFEFRQRAIELGEAIDLTGELAKMSDTQFGMWVRDQRLNYQGQLDLGNKTGLSWGEISARCAIGEGVCRTAFKKVANVDHQGLRIGHGGRFHQDNAAAYQGKAKVHGWIKDQGTEDEVLRARLAEISGTTELGDEFAEMTIKELKAQLAELGQPVTGNKATLAERLATVLAS